jgi:hypothetical protein
MERGLLDGEFSGLPYYLVIASSHISNGFQIFTFFTPCIIMKEITRLILTSELFYHSRVLSLT